MSLQADVFTAMLVLAANYASEVFTASFTSTTTESLPSILNAATEITEAPTPVAQPVCRKVEIPVWGDSKRGYHCYSLCLSSVGGEGGREGRMMPYLGGARGEMAMLQIHTSHGATVHHQAAQDGMP